MDDAAREHETGVRDQDGHMDPPKADEPNAASSESENPLIQPPDEPWTKQ